MNYCFKESKKESEKGWYVSKKEKGVQVSMYFLVEGRINEGV